MIWCLKIKIKSYIKKALLLLYAKNKLGNAEYFGTGVVALPKLKLKNVKYMSIGDECYFGSNCRIEAWDEYNGKTFNPAIIIGKDVRINSACHIGCINRVKIGDQCLLGSNVMIIDHSHGKNDMEELSIHPSLRDLYSKGEIVLGERCWVGENVVILPGVHIGDETVIGANSVVTKSMPEKCVIAGNPAHIVRKLV